MLALHYTFTNGGNATTFAARMGNGEMMVVSPSVGLAAADAAQLESFGKVGALVANNGLHHLGQTEWRARFPDARCFAAPEAAKRIRKKNRAVGAFEPLDALHELTGNDVGVRQAHNSECGETWCWARIAGGYAWYVSDVLANMPTLPKALVPKLLFWATGSAPGYRVFHLALKFIVKDKSATLKSMLSDLDTHPATVIIPAHGGILRDTDIAAKTRDIIKAAL